MKYKHGDMESLIVILKTVIATGVIIGALYVIMNNILK